jgi:uncharacterized protein YkwD
VCLIVASLSLLAGAVAPASAAECANADIRPSSDNLREVRGAVLCLLNQERSARGLRRLRSNAKLRKAAERHSRSMDVDDYFDHVSPTGSTPLQRVKAAGYLAGASSWSVGENIAWGEQRLSTPREIMSAWMHSAGHKANILNRSFRHVGIGVSLGAPMDGGSGAIYTTAFGKRS